CLGRHAENPTGYLLGRAGTSAVRRYGAEAPASFVFEDCCNEQTHLASCLIDLHRRIRTSTASRATAMIIHLHDEPTRTSDTEAGYLKRFKQLFNSIRKSNYEGDRDRKFTVTVFVDGLLEKRGSYRANSWRYNRNATIFGL